MQSQRISQAGRTYKSVPQSAQEERSVKAAAGADGSQRALRGRVLAALAPPSARWTLRAARRPLRCAPTT
eukprot:6183757-Pleurochrysis_carterae.AAC.2